jgi:hypothetical protein
MPAPCGTVNLTIGEWIWLKHSGCQQPMRKGAKGDVARWATWAPRSADLAIGPTDKDKQDGWLNNLARVAEGCCTAEDLHCMRQRAANARWLAVVAHGTHME